MKKVLHIIYDLSTAGAQTVVMNYMRNMKNDNDYHFTLLITEPFKDVMYEKELAVGNYDYKSCEYKPSKCSRILRPIVNWVTYQYKIWKVIKSERPDIIHTHLTNILPYVVFPAIFSRANKVHTLHSDPYAIPKKNVIWAWLAFHFFGFRPIAVTESQSKKACKRYKLSDIDIVHNGLDLNAYKQNDVCRQNVRTELGLDQDAFVIGTVGRFDKIKNFPYLIKVFSEYLKLNSSARLLMVGDGIERQQLEELVRFLNIENKVIFAGQRSDVQNMYKAMDLFMLTSFFESSSIVTVEAQLSGVRCVISSSIPDSVIITDKVNRISLYAPLDEWMSAISGQLPRDPQINDEIHFSIENTILELKQVYHRLK